MTTTDAPLTPGARKRLTIADSVAQTRREEEDSLSRSGSLAGLMNPGKVAEASRLGAMFGVDPSIYMDPKPEPPDAGPLSDDELFALNRKSPGMGRWLTDPRNLALVKDDLPSLHRIADALRKTAPALGKGFADDLLTAGMAGTLTWDRWYSWAKAKVGMSTPDEADAELAANAQARVNLSKRYSAETAAQQAEIEEADGFFPTLGAFLSNPRAAATTITESMVVSGPTMVIGGGAGTMAARGIAKALGGQATRLAMRLGAAGGQFAAESVTMELSWIDNAIASRGLTPGQALRDPELMAQAWAEAKRYGMGVSAVDAFSLFIAGRRFSGAKGVLKKAAAGARELSEQVVLGGGSEIVGQGAAVGPSGINWKDVALESAAELGQGSADIGMGVILHRAAMGGPEALPAKQAVQVAIEATDAILGAERLTEAKDAYVASKVAQRSPDRAWKLMEAAAGHGGARQVHVSRETWDKVWTAQGKSPATEAGKVFPGGDAAYHAQGGEITFPTGPYIAAVGATPAWDALLPGLRIEGLAMTGQEAQEELAARDAALGEAAQGQLLFQSQSEQIEGESADLDKQIAAMEGDQNRPPPTATPEVQQALADVMARGTSPENRAAARRTLDAASAAAPMSPEARVEYESARITEIEGMRDSLPADLQAAADEELTQRKASREAASADVIKLADLKARRTEVRGKLSKIAAEQEANRGAAAQLQTRLEAQIGASGTKPRETKIVATFLREMLSTLAERSGVPLADIGARLREVRAATPEDVAEARAAGQDKPLGATKIVGKLLDIIRHADANRTTLFHEGFHVGLELLFDLSQQEGMAQQIRDDVAAVLAKFGVAAPAEMTVAHKEQFAQWGEQTLFEGKAPSPELRRIIGTIRDWFVRAYRSLKALGVPIPDDMRGIFDRLLATDEQIAQARYEVGSFSPLPPEVVAQMEPDAQAAYWAAWNEDGDAAREAVGKRMLADITAERQAAFGARVAEVAPKIVAEIAASPGGRALAAMKAGQAPKLDSKAATDLYSARVVKALEAAGVLVADGGATPAVAAEALGYQTVDALGADLLTAANAEAVALRRAREQVRAESPDLVTEPEVRRMSRREAVATEHAKRLGLEIAAYKAAAAMEGEQKAAAAQGEPSLAEVRAEVEASLLRMGLDRIRPANYRQAARRQAALALKNALAKNYQAAAQAKAAERWNAEAARIGTNMLEEARKLAVQSNKLNGTTQQNALRQAGPSYLDNTNRILERYSFRPTPVSEPEAERRQTLLDFAAERAAEGRPLSIPDAVMNEARRKDYRTLTLDELRGVADTLAGIYHLATTKDKLSKIQRGRAIAAAADEAARQVRASRPAITHAKGAESKGERAWRGVQGFFAGGAKASVDALIMDGGKDGGPNRRSMIDPINDSAADQAKRDRKTDDGWIDLYAMLPEADSNALDVRRELPGEAKGLTLSDRLEIAKHWGNAYGRQRLLQQFTQEQINLILNGFTPAQLAHIKAFWEIGEATFQEAAEQQARLSGQDVKKVKRAPFTVTDTEGNAVTMPGGYAKLGYRDRRPWVSALRSTADWASATLAGVAGDSRTAAAMLDMGFLKPRTEEVTGRINLDRGLQFQHLRTMNHVIAFREAIRDVQAILHTPSLHGAIQEHYGVATLDAFDSWLKRQAAGESGAHNGLEHLFALMRRNTVMARLGFRIVTGLKQHLGFTQTIVRLGGGAQGSKYLLGAMKDWFAGERSMGETVEWAMDKSAVLRDRLQGSRWREIVEMRNDMPSKFRNGVTEMAFWWVVRNQFAQDMLAWMAGYQQAVDAIPAGKTFEDWEPEAIRRADQIVREAQGSGLEVDRSFWEGGNPLVRIFTTFYTDGAIKFNLTRLSASRTKFSDPISFGRFMGDMLFLYWLPTAIVSAVGAAVSGDDEPEKVAKKVVRNGLGELANTTAGLREFSGKIQGFQYGGPSGLGFIQEGGKFIDQVMQGELDAGLWKSAAMTLGTATGLPSSFAVDVVESMEQMLEGEAPTAIIGMRPKR